MLSLVTDTVDYCSAMAHFDLGAAPDDPLERLLHLLDVEAELERQLEREFATTYFEARLTGQIDAAIALRRHSRKRILAMTRAENHARGSSIRWGDGLDPETGAQPPSASSRIQPRE